MTLLSIGAVAKRAGVGVETVRFYERRGLLEEPGRKPSGYRQYSEGVVAWIRFIRRAKELGFSLKEVAELLALRLLPSITCAEVKERARAKLAAIEAKIADLQRMKSALQKLTVACKGRGPLQGCPILGALDRPEDAVGVDE